MSRLLIIAALLGACCAIVRSTRLQVESAKPQPMVKCPCCGGDGKETCHNPDHGLIGGLSFLDEGRLGCPVCGHHPKNKVKGGDDCEICDGAGVLPEEKARAFCADMKYDYEDGES